MISSLLSTLTQLLAKSGSWVKQHTSKALLAQCFAGVLLCLFAQEGYAALRIEQADAELKWTNARANAKANVTVLRYEDIGFYRYDPSSSQSYIVRKSHFSNQDTLAGTPQAAGLLQSPNPINPITGEVWSPSAQLTLPLAEASEYEYDGFEPMFVIAKNPILPISYQADGNRFIAVTIDVAQGQIYTITLTETTSGSGIFVGYLQPNIPGTNVVIAPGSAVNIRFDENGDVADSQTLLAPWNVNPALLNAIEIRRRANVSSKPLPLNELFLSKQALQTTAAIGDFVVYNLRVENTGINTLNNVEVIDDLPKGLRYQVKSVRIDESKPSDGVVSNRGNQIVFSLGNLAAKQIVNIRYVLEVTAQAEKGIAINTARARSAALSSNIARATVLIENELFSDRAFLLGRVIAGNCGQDDAPGIEGVRLYLEDGTNVITDKHGRWNIAGVMPGTHVLQLDTITLGPRYQLRQCFDNTRQAGNIISRFVNVQGGTLWRENWYVEVLSGIEDNIEQQLTSILRADGQVDVKLQVKSGEIRFSEIVSEIVIPDLLVYVPDSSTLNGEPISDLDAFEKHRQFTYPAADYFTEYSLGFRLAVEPNAREDVVRTLLVRTTGKSLAAQNYSVISTNRMGVKSVKNNDNSIVVRPRFSSLSSELSNEDIVNINKAIVPLMGRENLRLKVIGHSDNQAIKPRAGRAINDNYALSKARADMVADYLAQLLKIAREDVVTEGLGPDLPIADNKTAEGRSANRRVAIEFSYSERQSDASLQVLEGDSGLRSDKKEIAENNNIKEAAGFINVKQDTNFTQPIFSVLAQVDSRLTAKLLLNNKEISSGRIGMRMADPKTGLTRYTWVGLELEEVGAHTLELQGVDPFGNARFNQKIDIRRSGQIKTIRLLEVVENTADGRSPIVAKLQLLDEFDKEISSGAELSITVGELRPLNFGQLNNPLDNRPNIVRVDSDGIVRFDPVSTAGNYRISIAADQNVKADIDIPVKPEMRDWILVGFAEGTVGYNTLSGNMSDLRNEENHGYVNGEAALFARGQIKGEWLMTVAYDSRKTREDSPLMQRIDPQKWYVLYGDDTLRSHDAPSSKKLYLRIERADFYALFGDYDTGLNVTELTAYQRTLTGLKSEYSGKNVSALGFVAETTQGFIRDDIAADGTSGLYRLSRNNIIPGSDIIEIEVRDRFTNEVIETRAMSRYVDYYIDYMDGTMYFRSPVTVQDANFNPQRIVAKYEVNAGAEEVVAGGRVSVHDAAKKIEVGLTVVDDNTANANGSLAGADLTWKPNQAHTLKAEIANSRQSDISNVDANGSAWLIEHVYTSEKIDTRVRLDEKDSGFGMGQIASDDDDIRTALASARYRFNEQWSLNGDMSHQKLLSSANQRDTVEGRVEYNKKDWQMYSGLRHADDKRDMDSYQSQQLIAGVKRSLFDQRLALSVRGETGISSDENIDYPNLLSFGADYRLTSAISLFTNQDFTWGADRRAQETRAGVRATPWQGASISSDVSRAQDEYGPRVLAHAGVMQTMNINANWSADFGFDRSQTLSEATADVQPFDDRRPTAFGTRNDDYTATYAGAAYRDAQWQITNRVEFRHADTDDKWTFMSGFQRRMDDTDTMAGRILHFDQKMREGADSRSTELDFSYSHRPLSESWFWLNRTKLAVEALDDVLGTVYGRRIVNNTHVNNVFMHRHQLSLQYGARYVFDTIDSERYKGYTDLWGGEYRYDITPKWDVGARTSILNSYNSDNRFASLGLMVGYSPIKDVWVSLGYNVKGFYDKDFDGAESRVKGFVLDFRIKFDQNSFAKKSDDNQYLAGE